MKTKAPKCKCGKPCQLYGGVGGYSKCCQSCNERNAARQRVGRKKAKGGLAYSYITITYDLSANKKGKKKPSIRKWKSQTFVHELEPHKNIFP